MATIKLTLALSAVLIFCTGCVAQGKYEDLEQQQAAMEAELESAQNQLAALQSEEEKLRSEREKLHSERERLREDLEKTKATYGNLVKELETEVADGRVFVEQARDGIRVRLTNDVLFPSGSAAVNEDGRDVISRVSDQLAQGDFRIEVQGYTDSQPIGAALAKRYPSNWELAAARASEVVRLLEENGVAEDRLSSVSFGETRAIADNETAEGRAANRRIEIRLVPLERGIGDLPAVATPPPDK